MVKPLTRLTLLVILIIALIVLSVAAGAALSTGAHATCHDSSPGTPVPMACQVK